MAVIPNFDKGFCQFGLPPDLAELRHDAILILKVVLQKGDWGICLKIGSCSCKAPGEFKTIFGKVYGGLYQIRPGKYAMLLMCQIQAGHRTGYPYGLQANVVVGRFRTEEIGPALQFPVSVQEHVCCGFQRGFFPKVKGGCSPC